MIEGKLLELGVGVIVIIMVLREVFSYLKTQKSNSLTVTDQHVDEMHTLTHGMDDKINDLHKWHDQKDTDGIFSWYVPRSFETVLEKLAVNISANTEMVKEHTYIIGQQKDVQKKLLTHMQKVDERLERKEQLMTSK